MIQGDCLEVMRQMDSNSIDFVVTDPPYGLAFMNKDWDKCLPSIDIWKEALRVCKPGAFIACFGGTRTFHRLTCFIEDAGWEIRDCVSWIYGSGFPKGKGCLKPAWEPIILARKREPNPRLNIEGCRIGTMKDMNSNDFDDTKRKSPKFSGKFNGGKIGEYRERKGIVPNGRWPANLILDEESAKALDEQTGITKSSASRRINKPSKNKCMSGDNTGHISFGHNDSGGASRFFYCAKASTKERDGSIHPTMKPISLMKYLIKLLAPPNDPVLLDPFCGSGSTLKAANELGIRSIGIELSEEYCEIARKRTSC